MKPVTGSKKTLQSPPSSEQSLFAGQTITSFTNQTVGANTVHMITKISSKTLGSPFQFRAKEIEMVETVFKTIKSELIWRHSFKTRDSATNAIAQYINGFYNPKHRHSALGYQRPIQFENKNLKLAA